MTSTAADLITDGVTFNVNSIKYGKPTVNKRGGKNISVNDKNNNRLSLNYPLMLTWGIQEARDMETQELRGYDMTIQFQGENDDEDVRSFREKLANFEEKILSDCMKNCKEWLNKAKLSRDTAEELMNAMLKYPKDKDTKEVDKSRNPTLKIKVPYYDQRFTMTEIYDLEENQLFAPKGEWEKTPSQLVPKGCWTAGIITCGGIYFASGKFGVTWQLNQVMVRPPLRIQGTCLVKLSKSSQNKVEELKKQDEEVDNNEQSEVVSKYAYESDDNVESENENKSDSESESEDEKEAPPPPVKRKVVRKKAGN